MSNDDKDEVKLKAAPEIVREEIPDGLAGAAYLKKWQHLYRREFDRQYARFCKPYR